jgi:hypothetical protein
MNIVGVVADVKQASLDREVMPAVYLPAAQLEGLRLHQLILHYAVREQGDPMAIAPVVRAEVAKLDPSLPVFQLKTMGEAMSGVAGSAPLSRRTDEAVCGGSYAAGCHGVLRRAGIHGGAIDAGNRDPDGAGSVDG